MSNHRDAEKHPGKANYGNGVPDPLWFEDLYRTYNRREYINPDPLLFVYRFGGANDREVAGFIASSLAFGRVSHILESLGSVFGALPEPAAMVRHLPRSEFGRMFLRFRHRWTSGDDLADLLAGLGRLLRDYGSLNRCFLEGVGDGDRTVLQPLTAFVASLNRASGRDGSNVVACPSRGSACKRLLLFLRWMVRRDDVDPGIWTGISPSRLVVPMDTHMHRISVGFGLTRRRQPDIKGALEVTEYFRRLAPHDPVRYDFALTRPAIRGGKAVAEAFSGRVPPISANI